VLDFPVIDNDELAKVQHFETRSGRKPAHVIKGPIPIDEGRAGSRSGCRRCATRPTRPSRTGRSSWC
jgi:hypothetical protein